MKKEKTNNKKTKKKILDIKVIQKLKKVTSKIDLTKNKFNTIELILIFIMALVFGLLLGEILFSSGKTNASLTEKTNNNISEIKNVYDTLLEEYINQIDEEELKEAAINGMVSILKDQHSVYYNDEESEEFKDEINGYFYGMGAAVYQEQGGLVTIGEIYENSPAEKAGLKEGDQYLKINDEDVTKLTAEEISEKIKGKNGKTFKLTVKRSGKEVETSVTTAKVEIPSVSKEIITKENQKIGYLQVSVFASNTDEQFEKKLQELEKEGIEKLIIDLRYNQGGQLETVINIASQFLTKKDPIIKIVDKSQVETKYSVKNGNKDYKIVVLINEGSASGSEVLAAALNEQLDAELIGTTTYGKGTVQKTKNLPSGGVIKYTVETWKTSKGKDIDGKGIKPTIEVEQDENYYKTYEKTDDTQLQKAIEVILKK
ncbi:MAG: S41 family peptidase [Bacilli bacterium]